MYGPTISSSYRKTRIPELEDHIYTEACTTPVAQQQHTKVISMPLYSKKTAPPVIVFVLLPVLLSAIHRPPIGGIGNLSESWLVSLGRNELGDIGSDIRRRLHDLISGLSRVRALPISPVRQKLPHQRGPRIVWSPELHVPRQTVLKHTYPSERKYCTSWRTNPLANQQVHFPVAQPMDTRDKNNCRRWRIPRIYSFRWDWGQQEKDDRHGLSPPPILLHGRLGSVLNAKSSFIAHLLSRRWDKEVFSHESQIRNHLRRRCELLAPPSVGVRCYPTHRPRRAAEATGIGSGDPSRTASTLWISSFRLDVAIE